MLLWKTCHSIHPSFFYCMSACPALRVTEGAVALPRYLGVKAGKILDKLPVYHKASSRQTTNCAYINFCGYLGRTHADTERACCAQERSEVRIKPATFLLWDNSANQCTIKVIHTDLAQIRLISVLHKINFSFFVFKSTNAHMHILQEKSVCFFVLFFNKRSNKTSMKSFLFISMCASTCKSLCLCVWSSIITDPIFACRYLADDIRGNQKPIT